MGKYTKSNFENPYLDEAARKITAELVMDEARQKWRAGNWRAKPNSFNITRDELAADEQEICRPDAERFDLDVKRDLMGDTISLASLRELDYSPSYRPKGKLDIANEYTVGPMSTLQRYDVLAGELEAPPEDLSFLSDAQTRLKRELEKKQERKDGRLRRDSRRLSESLDKRRTEVIRMIPEEKRGRADDIILEAKRRKELEDRELGIKPEETPKPLSKPPRQSIVTTDDPIAAAHARIKDSRLDRLPEQIGMSDVTQELPEFASETRRWSEIESENPTWSEVAAHTDVTIPKDDEPRTDSRARYISDELYSPRHRYMSVDGQPPRTRLRADGTLPFENEYLKEANIDTHRVREIMEKQYHGRWIPPEYFDDQEMVNEWFNRYNRGALTGEDYVTWAYRQRLMAQERQEREMAARRQQQARDVGTRRHSPYGRADGSYEPRRADPLDDPRYEEARRQGYRRGAQISGRERVKAEREQQAERARRPEAAQPGARPPAPQGMPPQGYMPQGMPGYPPGFDPQRMPAAPYPPQQGKPSAPPPYGGQFPPYVYPFGQPPQGAQPAPQPDAYGGMYPDLFGGRGAAAPQPSPQQMQMDMQRQIDQQLRQAEGRRDDARPSSAVKRGRH